MYHEPNQANACETVFFTHMSCLNYHRKFQTKFVGFVDFFVTFYDGKPRRHCGPTIWENTFSSEFTLKVVM